MKTPYRFPFSQSVERRAGKPSGEYAHENFPECRHAVDFILDVDTPILASRAGLVAAIKSDSDRWGLDRDLADEANYVAVDHGDGTYAEYVHLGKNKVVVQEGQDVAAGDLLGYSGLSDCMSHPHLHFNVFRIEHGEASSIPVEFAEVGL